MWRHLPSIPACGPFSQPEGANNSKTMRAGRKSTGHVTSATWRRLLLISAVGAFRDFQSTDIPGTVKAGCNVSKEHEYETKVDPIHWSSCFR
jgi:hypothetical protein